jgi:hypothetical protein
VLATAPPYPTSRRGRHHGFPGFTVPPAGPAAELVVRLLADLLCLQNEHSASVLRSRGMLPAADSCEGRVDAT